MQEEIAFTNNPEFDNFCNDYDFITASIYRQEKRIKALKSKGYTDEQIHLGKIEYKKRKEEETRLKKYRNNIPPIIDLIEISEWKGDKKNVTFDDIIGLDKAKLILNERFDTFYEYINDMKQYKIEPPSGLGLYGVPGVGKSELMKALLNKINKDTTIQPKPLLLYISISDLLSGQRGEVSKMVKLMFDNIKKLDRLVIICIDEIDMVMRGKNDTNSVLTRELTSIFLQQWNGSGNIFVVFSSNNLQDIEDTFISRIGYENCVLCNIPSTEERKLLMQKYMTFPITEEHINLIVKLTEGYVGRDIKKLAAPIYILTQQNKHLILVERDECIINKIDEINKLKNTTIDEMHNNSKRKNTANKYKVFDIPKTKIEVLEEDEKKLNKTTTTVPIGKELNKIFRRTNDNSIYA